MEDNNSENELNSNEQYQEKPPVYKQVWFWFVLAISFIIIIGSISGLSNNSNDSNKNGYQNEQSISGTLGELNALASAKNYLRTMPFSRQGLIDQLEFEGYSTSEATFAVNNCGADWFEQAAKKAQDYLDTMPFSRQGLIDQLEFEGFTHEQAVYGVEAVGY